MEQLGINLPKLIYQIINFVIMAGILYVLLYQRVLNMLAERSKRIEQSLQDAEKVKRQLSEAEAEKAKVINEARAEAQAIVAQAQDRAKAQASEIVDQARREAEKIRDDARTQSAQERDQLLREAKDQIADLVTLTASRVIGAELKAAGHDKLIAESLAALDRRN